MATILFTSLMLILLSFFIMMNTMAVIDDGRSRAAIGSLLSEFAGARSLDGSPGADIDLNLGDKPSLRVADLQRHLDELLGKMKVDGDVQVYLRGRDLALRLPAYLLMSDDASTLTTEGQTLLGEMGRLLRPSDRQVRVEGHAAGETGRDAPDVERREWSDSLNRSLLAAGWLADEGGLGEARIEAAGLGATQPLASAEAPWLNARVELVVVDGAEDPRIRAYPFEVKIGNRTFRKVTDDQGRQRYEKLGWW